MSTRIQRVWARQVLDSRAHPTVEVDVVLESGARGRAIAPSGASTGKFEALELRDGDPGRYGGKSVLRAVRNVNEVIGPALVGIDALDQAEVDTAMIQLDGTPSKSRLGANAILGASLATAWAAAGAMGMPLYRYLGGDGACTLPVPQIQIIGGGLHANGQIDIQDFLVIPVGASTYSEALEMVVNVYHATRQVFSRLGKPVSVADEGGLWPTFGSNAEGLDLLMQGIVRAGYEPGKQVAIALDVASSHFYREGSYRFALEGREMTSSAFADVLESWVERYPILSLEDGMAEEDWEGWELLTRRLGGRVQLIGDDLFTTRVDRIQQGIQRGVANAVLIKLNQVGTLTETLQAIKVTREAGYLPVISARSGETEDTTITHLAVATGAGQLKVGSVARSERTVKWNELLRIEEELGSRGIYPGRDVFRPIVG